MDELLMEDGAVGAFLDSEADEISAAVDDLMYDNGDDIDQIAEITDDDVENCDYDPESDSEYYEDVDTDDYSDEFDEDDYLDEDDLI
jgi:hypothetical protein